jgi:hypothetical protein
MQPIKVPAFDTGGTILDWHGGLAAMLGESGARRGSVITARRNLSGQSSCSGPTGSSHPIAAGPTTCGKAF